MNEYGRLDNLTGRVLATAFLLNCRHLKDGVSASAITDNIQRMDKGEMEELKKYVRTGSFL